MKKTVVVLFLAAATAFPQLSVGVKAGVPLTDFFDTVSSPNFGFNSNTKRYIIGPMVQLNLPAGFAVEFDALYRRLNYESDIGLVDVFTNRRTTGNAWEFPLLFKYRFSVPMVRPFVGAGVAWDTLTGVKQSVTNTLFPSNRVTTGSTEKPAELQNDTTTGFVIGAGVDVHAIFLHISPEFRYTRWGSNHFRDATGGLISNRNQAEFLVGFRF